MRDWTFELIELVTAWTGISAEEVDVNDPLARESVSVYEASLDRVLQEASDDGELRGLLNDCVGMNSILVGLAARGSEQSEPEVLQSVARLMVRRGGLKGLREG